jgi:ferritin-like metal-binding protein YciE
MPTAIALRMSDKVRQLEPIHRHQARVPADGNVPHDSIRLLQIASERRAMTINQQQKLSEHVEYVRALSDLFHVERALEEALPEMAGAAESSDLAAAFHQHHRATREHVRRLDAILRNGIEQAPMQMPGNSVTPLIHEGSQIIDTMQRGAERDAALLALARRVEQKEISLYASVIRSAESVGLPMTYVHALARNQQEETEADNALAKLEPALKPNELRDIDSRGF